MANSGFNLFVVILGFCLLGLPIILISVTTAPPTPSEFQSVISINTVPGDTASLTYLNETSKINGNSSYFDSLESTELLSLISNISQLIYEENEFMKDVDTKEYGGLSDMVHVFSLEMNISLVVQSTEIIMNTYNGLFGYQNNGTFIVHLAMDEHYAFHYTELGYLDVNETISDVVSTYLNMKYIITLNYFADIEIEGVQQSTSFHRLILLEDDGTILFFISDETGWTTIE